MDAVGPLYSVPYGVLALRGVFGHRDSPCAHRFTIGYSLTAAGALVFNRACLVCLRYDSNQIAHGIALALTRGAGLSPRDLPPLVKPNAGEPPVCAKCGARYAENHHWAPEAIFKDEAWDWPQSYLCRACHRRWHDVMEANGLILRREATPT